MRTAYGLCTTWQAHHVHDGAEVALVEHALTARARVCGVGRVPLVRPLRPLRCRLQHSCIRVGADRREAAPQGAGAWQESKLWLCARAVIAQAACTLALAWLRRSSVEDQGNGVDSQDDIGQSIGVSVLNHSMFATKPNSVQFQVQGKHNAAMKHAQPTRRLRESAIQHVQSFTKSSQLDGRRTSQP